MYVADLFCYLQSNFNRRPTMIRNEKYVTDMYSVIN
jgi:hypothetical protein